MIISDPKVMEMRSTAQVIIIANIIIIPHIGGLAVV